MLTLDASDRRILRILQRQADIGLEALGDKVGLSRNACWRRIKALDQAGAIRRRVAILDAEMLGLGLSVFIQIRTNSHSADWAKKFSEAMRDFPEILGAYRMSGDLDYLIRARVADVAAYDRLYQRLIQKIEVSDVSASFVMEELKETTELPI
jgi:Lrp/AsnC family transcriptional regulator